MVLYDYFRSSAAYRVRIALNLKGLSYEQEPISLVKGEHNKNDYLSRNPQGLVPALKLDDGTVLTQSLAICEYLEEHYPEPALLPTDPLGRARVRALTQVIACDIHPVNNLRILNYLVGTLGISEDAKLDWYRHWIAQGFTGLEALLQNSQTKRFCHADSPTFADVCLVPQMYNAHRFKVDLTPYPNIRRINASCSALEAFERARPEFQPDAVA